MNIMNNENIMNILNNMNNMNIMNILHIMNKWTLWSDGIRADIDWKWLEMAGICHGLCRVVPCPF